LSYECLLSCHVPIPNPKKEENEDGRFPPLRPISNKRRMKRGDIFYMGLKCPKS